VELSGALPMLKNYWVLLDEEIHSDTRRRVIFYWTLGDVDNQ
jgi:hypothetical protein